jgi:hypothetical protein
MPKIARVEDVELPQECDQYFPARVLNLRTLLLRRGSALIRSYYGRDSVGEFAFHLRPWRNPEVGFKRTGFRGAESLYLT